MRSFGSFTLACAVFLGANYVFAQAVDDPPLQFDPYNKHHDRHLGHNHVYPDRGAVFRDPPKGSTIVNYAGLAYRFYNGVWFEPRGPAFIVVMPPIGVVVSTLPSFATTLKSGGETYLYANEVYYLARPDLGGYEVVNDPEEFTSSVKAAAPASAAAPAAAMASSALPVGTTAVATPVAPIAKTHLASLGTTDLAASTGVASAQATSKVPGTPQTLRIPSEPEDNADAEIRTYSYAPDTAQAASRATTASGSTSHSTGVGAAGALIVPAVAGASLAATQGSGSAPATSAASGAGNWTVTEIRGTKTVSLTSGSNGTTVPASSGSAAFGSAPPVAGNSTVAVTTTPAPAAVPEGSAAFGTAHAVANPANNPTVAASSPTGGPSAGTVPAATGAAAVGVAPALAINSMSAAAPAIAGPTPAASLSLNGPTAAAPPIAATGSEGPIHLAANTPSVATQAPPATAAPPASTAVTNAPPAAPSAATAPSASTAPSAPVAPSSTAPPVAPNAADAVTPHSSAGYRYTSPPSTSDYPTSGTVHTTAESSTAAPVPAPGGATTTTSPPSAAPVPGSQGGIRFSAYPRNGQSPDQQARDQYDCYRFGVAETGFDPMGGTVPAAGKPGQAEFDRARAACFEGRGYSLSK